MMFASIVLILSFSASQVMADTPAYAITDLGTLGGTSSWATAINDDGQVVGSSTIDEDSALSLISGGSIVIGPARHGFLYDGTTMHDLGTLGGEVSSAYGINNNGQIVGNSASAGYVLEHPFLYDGTTMYNFDVSGDYTVANAINDSGLIVGGNPHIVVLVGGGGQITNGAHAFLYDGSIMHDLGTLGGSVSVAYGINNSGQVVGDSATAGNAAHHAFLYDGTTMHDLGTLGGTYSHAYDINNDGQVVGSSTIRGDPVMPGSSGLVKVFVEHAFKCSYRMSFLSDLGTLGGLNSQASAINDSGQVVGSSTLAGDLVRHAFLHDGGVMIDLNTLLPADSGWELTSARDINNSGQIVGSGIIGGQTHAFLMTPVLEPEMLSVHVDIKPQSCPNPLNVKSKGVLPVVILSTDVFDVNEIDPNSLEILGIGPIRYSYEDVAAPADANALPEECVCSTEGPDGYTDMTLKFDTSEMIEAIVEVEDGDYVVLTLTGSLKDGTPIEGTDCVMIIKKGKP